MLAGSGALIDMIFGGCSRGYVTGKASRTLSGGRWDKASDDAVEDVAMVDADWNGAIRSIVVGPCSDMGISKLSSRPDLPATTGWTVRRSS